MILIVEDESLFSQSIAEMLDGFGKRIIITTDGDQALAKIEKYHYALAIIDLVLPGPMNGLEVIKKIKMHTPSTKVIAISGYGNQSLIQKSYKAGAEVFLSKPFKPVELIDQVENLLFHRKVEKSDSVVEKNGPKSPFHTNEQTEPVIQQQPVAPPPPPPVQRPQHQPQTASNRVDANTVPQIFKSFPQNALAELVKFGKILKVTPGQRFKVNYSEYILVVISGSVNCFKDNRDIGILYLNESIGQESLTKDIDPNLKVIIEAREQSKLFLISKVQLIRYLSNNTDSLLIIFKNNLKHTLKNNIILNADKKQVHIPPPPSIPKPPSPSPPPAPTTPAAGQANPKPNSDLSQDPDIDLGLDSDSLDMFGI